MNDKPDLKLVPVTIRLTPDLVAKLKELARAEGLGYQPYVRQLLTKHVRLLKGKK